MSKSSEGQMSDILEILKKMGNEIQVKADAKLYAHRGQWRYIYGKRTLN